MHKIIVVNHSLFFSDLALRAELPDGGIIPEYDHVVFDEAHHLEDIASKSFGIDFGSKRLHWLLEKVHNLRGIDIGREKLDSLALTLAQRLLIRDAKWNCS